MNHTLLSQNYPLDYTLPSENEYLAGERPFSTTSHYTTSDYFPSNRKGGIGSLAPSISMPISTGFRQYSIPDSSLHSTSTQLLLSPPESESSSLPMSTPAPSSSNQYSGSTPKYFSSNASSAEPYSNAHATSLPQLLFGQSNMSDYSTRTRAPAPFHPSPASAMNYAANGVASFQSASHLPNPFQSHGLQRIQRFPGTSDLNGPRYTTQPPYLHPPAASWAPRDTWSLSNMPETRSGRQNSPPFEDTKVVRQLLTHHGHHVSLEIIASIPKGFFEVEGKWTCYRRNYFPVQCSFSAKPHVSDGTYYLQREGQAPVQIVQFAVSISAKTAVMNNQESQSRGLVQHTPKRDKATESTPGKVLIQPSPQLASESRYPSHQAYHSRHTISPNLISNYEAFAGGQQQSPPTLHTFERIQFQKATANNGKRRAQQQFFHVVVELWGNIGRGNSEWVELASRQSAQMVVRGRSPGHYKDNGRRDSTASMDPDRGSGSGGDSMFHSNAQSFGSHSHSSGGGMDWTQASSGGSHAYDGGTYRRQAEIYSPDSENSSGTFNEPRVEIDAEFKSRPGTASPRVIERSASEVDYGNAIDLGGAEATQSSSHKRGLEEERHFTPSTLDVPRSYNVGAFLPSHFEYSSSQPLSVL